MARPYLEEHTPKTRQFRRPRRSKVSGVIVVHTAESVMDRVGPDTGAENVASFIQGRSDYGSYHLLVDSDSIVHLVGFDAEAYGDGTGSNTHAIHISFACSAADWAGMSTAKRNAFILNGAKAAAQAARWLRNRHGIDVPRRRISRAESEQRKPGFISHGERDPGRRTDPGANFPWRQFLDEYEKEMRPKRNPERTAKAITAAIQKAKRAARIALEDGFPGPAKGIEKRIDGLRKVRTNVKKKK